jgi:predicted lipid-binding transport protein (Tim44 family)
MIEAHDLSKRYGGKLAVDHLSFTVSPGKVTDRVTTARTWAMIAPGSPPAGPQRHTGDMGRIIGTIFGAILAIWLAVTAAGGIAATLKTFVIVGLIAMAVFVVVWLVARRSGRG